MRYQVTCDNCGKKFLAEAEPGQTVKCVCPECGGTMQFTLPLTVYPKASSSGASSSCHAGRSPRSRSRRVNPVMIGITIGLSVLVALAAVLFFSSRFGNRPVKQNFSGYVVDTVATRIDYEHPSEPEYRPDTIVVDVPETEPEPEQEQETEPGPESEENVEVDTAVVE